MKARNRTRRLPLGTELLHDPLLNKGTALTKEERDIFKLHGLLPPHVFTQEEQVARVLENFNRKNSDLEKYIFLIALQDRNEKLFYRVVLEHPDVMLPIIYTPTVGEACRRFAHIFRRPRGLYLTARDRGQVAEVLRNWPSSDVGVIVVTDGERILGLGDLGANGMGIPIGKLSLYTACAGIAPWRCLPVMLDVGTENEDLLADALYFGIPQKRLRGPAYDELVEEFLQAVREVFPNALVQFEDFATINAFRLLEKHRDQICCFNDDIQGTGAVVMAGLEVAGTLNGKALKDQTLLLAGAGSAAMGITGQFEATLIKLGKPMEEIRRQCWLVDSKGLIVEERRQLSDFKRRYTQACPPMTDLTAMIEKIRPTVLIGVSGQPQIFTQPVLEKMAEINSVPVILALSNPTSKSECTAEQAYNWTQGRAIFASGSPFDPVKVRGSLRLPGQGNNAYIFPGLGLGVLVSGAERVVDEMLLAAAKTLAQAVSGDRLDQGCIYPPLNRIREVSASIAVAVIETAKSLGLARKAVPEDILGHVKSLMFDPAYENYQQD